MRKEFAKKFFMGALAFFLGFVAMANFIHALGIFLLELGPEHLPFSIVAVSGLVLLHQVTNALAAEKMKADKIFAAAILFVIANYVALMFLQIGEFAHSFYFFVIAFLTMWLHEGLLTQFTSSIFTPLQSKRYLPFVLGFMNLGLVLGALFAEQYKVVHEFLGIGTLAIAGLFVVLILIGIVGRKFKYELTKTLHEEHTSNLAAEILYGAEYLFGESKLYRLLMVAVILFVGLHISIDFKLKTVLAESFGHGSLTEMLGLVFMVRSLGAWIINTTLVRRLLFRFGVSNMLIFFPASVLAITLVATLLGLTYPAVITVFLVFSLSHFSYYEICLSQMLAVVPERFERGVHFLIHGFFYALGMIGFSLILLLYTNDIALESTFNTAVILIASGVLIPILVRIKRLYFGELKANLNSQSEFLKLRSIDLFAEASSIKSGEPYLRRMLELPTLEVNVKARVIGSLGVIGNAQTIVDLTKILEQDEDPKMKLESIHAINTIIQTARKKLDSVPVTKHYLLRTYEKVLLSSVPSYVKSEVIAALKYFDLEDVMSFLEQHLNDKSVQIRQNVLKTLATFRDRGIIPYLEPFLDSKHLALQSEAIVGLWQFEEMRIKVLPRLTALLASTDPKAIECTLSILGSIRATWDKEYVHEQLENGDEHIRLHALVTLIEFGDTEHTELFTQKLLGYVQQDDMKELDFALSHYRGFPDAVRSTVVKLIQEMSDAESSALLQAFRDSKFVFSTEIAALSVG